jgi:hypothetical protein
LTAVNIEVAASWARAASSILSLHSLASSN